MAMMKGTLGLILAAAVLAAGVHAVIVPRAPVPPVPPAEPSAPSASAAPGEMTQALGQLREALAAAKVVPPAETAPTPAPVMPAPPLPRVEDKPPEKPAAGPGGQAAAIQGDPAVAEDPSAGRPAAVPPDPSWVPIPRPELVAKADALLDNGDVAGARFWFAEALAQGDADAAFRLAETYDPRVLAEWKVIGIASDVAKARALYERAMHGGVEPARQALARLSR